MVFRRDNKSGDSFQRQISAFRQQVGNSEATESAESEREEAWSPRDRGAPLAPEAQTAELAPFNGGSPDEGEPMDTDAPLYAAPIADASTTIIANDASWKGELASNGTVHVHGRFEGSIKAKSDVYVAEEADVDATLTADRVIIAGMVKGSIRCGARFEVLPSGRLTGDIQSPTLVVHEGATVNGQFRMGVPDAAEELPTSVIHRRAARGAD